MIMEVQNLSKFFGGIKAVDDVSFSVEEGELGAIIGPNGAGKTTIFNLIMGEIKSDKGKIIFDKHDITNIETHKLHKFGIGRAFQVTNIFSRFTAYENIQIAILSQEGKTKNFLKNADKMVNDEAMEILNSLGLYNKRDIVAGLLAHGDQKLLDIGIALAGNPKMILLDEPTAGMSPQESKSIVELIKSLATERKLTVMIIEHDMNVVFDISERIRVLHLGRLIADGLPNEIRNDEQVQNIYLGHEE